MFALCGNRPRDLLRDRRVFPPLRQIGRQDLIAFCLRCDYYWSCSLPFTTSLEEKERCYFIILSRTPHETRLIILDHFLRLLCPKNQPILESYPWNYYLVHVQCNNKCRIVMHNWQLIWLVGWLFAHYARGRWFDFRAVQTIDLVLIDQQSEKETSIWWALSMRKRDGRLFTDVSTNYWKRATKWHAVLKNEHHFWKLMILMTCNFLKCLPVA
jgi:hypothetical protein